MKIQRHLVSARQNNRARNAVRKVVMLPRTVIDRILAAARRPALKAMELGNQAADIKELTLAAVQTRGRCRRFLQDASELRRREGDGRSVCWRVAARTIYEAQRHLRPVGKGEKRHLPRCAAAIRGDILDKILESASRGTPAVDHREQGFTVADTRASFRLAPC
jgi:hypothetical protein